MKLQNAILEEATVHREVHKALRADRKVHWDLVADEIQVAMDRGDQKRGHQLAQILAGIRSGGRSAPCKADGSFPMDDEEILAIWKDHLAEERGMIPQNRGAPRPTRPPELDFAPHGEEEIRQAINSLKAGRATKAEGIPTVALQILQDELLPHLPHIFDEAASREYPLDWATNGLFWLKKPGKAVRGASTFRDICLMEAMSKVYSKILLWRVQDRIPTQFGF